ncbi:MAG: 50S ribosomal protein L25 [Spirochaetaceae bacterium]|jgi:large subunit ribosomal protein L25|nr:50S ribosomal protein L25 [Spirochaetaceae bacterium]
MSEVVFQARKRTDSGSAEARRLRRQGRIPAVIYGAKGQSQTIDLDAVEFAGGLRGISESTIVKVTIDNESHDAFVKDTQRNMVSGGILHVDFYEIDTNQILRARVPLNVFGNPVGIRNGGIFESPLHDIEVECLPRDLPPRISVDVSGLDVNQSIHVRDLALGEGVRLISGGDQVIALVKFAKAEEAAAVEETAPAEPADAKKAEAKA